MQVEMGESKRGGRGRREERVVRVGERGWGERGSERRERECGEREGVWGERECGERRGSVGRGREIRGSGVERWVREGRWERTGVGRGDKTTERLNFFKSVNKPTSVTALYFHKWESYWMMPQVGDFLRDLQFPLSLHSGAAPLSFHFTLIGFSRPLYIWICSAGKELLQHYHVALHVVLQVLLNYLLLLIVGAMLAEWLAHLPPTKANRVQSPAVSLDFHMWESCRTMLFICRFSQVSPITPNLSLLRCSILTLITLIGSQDFAGPCGLAARALAFPQVNRVQFPAKSLPHFRTGEMCQMMPLVHCFFLGDLPFHPPLHSGTAPFPPCFILIGSHDLAPRRVSALAVAGCGLVIRAPIFGLQGITAKQVQHEKDPAPKKISDSDSASQYLERTSVQWLEESISWKPTALQPTSERHVAAVTQSYLGKCQGQGMNSEISIWDQPQVGWPKGGRGPQNPMPDRGWKGICSESQNSQQGWPAKGMVVVPPSLPQDNRVGWRRRKSPLFTGSLLFIRGSPILWPYGLVRVLEYSGPLRSCATVVSQCLHRFPFSQPDCRILITCAVAVRVGTLQGGGKR
ncbi:hypothetical protein PR048_008644 [Dryococelus australis]|uniref:Uncharacterized protein n=1 Tax=Dryococelus australis TaxID=614101 RepID=A0ABQ9HYN7_9NEOP|nr:hypothetical protein PR048_008644 [Dryococelus australis]